MSGPGERVDGERLADEPELGALLRRANVEYRAGLDEPAAFRRTVERLAPRPERRSPRARFAVGAGLACAAAAGWLVWFEAGRSRGPELMFGPDIAVQAAPGRGERPRAARPLGEVPALAEAPAARAPVAPPMEAVGDARQDAADARHGPRSEPSPGEVSTGRLRALERGDDAPPMREERDERDERQLPDGREGRGRDALDDGARPQPAPRRSQATELTPVTPVTPEPVTPGPGARVAVGAREPGALREDCLELARQGQPRAAERCFEQRAAGSGLGAEMALYEMARLRRDVLRDAVGALAALSAYRERFARGSLRNEVDLSRVELLAELGRSTEALQESAALLAGASGRERAAELHMLRGNVYRRDLGDLRAAASEYAQVEALGGPRGAEASRLLGASLEGLGDTSGALAAYRRYASDPQRPYVGDVQRRIQRLAGTPSGAGPSP